MLKNKIGKRGMGEVFSWAAGLIFIFAIVIVSVVIYDVGGMGKKIAVDASSSAKQIDFSDALNSQRIGVEFLMNDFLGKNKGELLSKIRSGVADGGPGLGGVVGENSFGSIIDNFVKFISYNRFTFNINRMLIASRSSSNMMKIVSVCPDGVSPGSFYLLGDRKVGVSIERCKNA